MLTPASSSGKCNDRCFLYPGMTIESGLDFAKLDAIAAPLDHPVTAAEVRVAAIRRLGNDVARPIPAVPARIEMEAFRRLLR